ncbi:MAG: hypothetical protein KGL39_22360 [Patescibacteria group bacterium]|nr:hypothetical protein [Patescibacteria group bacterium]
MICKHCSKEFKPFPGKPGYINECPGCVKGDVEKLGGNMIWSHKTAPEIEIKPLNEAKRFARKTRRIGTTVTQSLVTTQSTTPQDAAANSKHGSGAEAGAMYYSRLGEKRHVKR